MLLKIGRFEFEARRHLLYVSVPGVGVACAARGHGLTWNRWGDWERLEQARDGA